MVTLQILVLPFLVRVRVPQHKKGFHFGSLFCVPWDGRLLFLAVLCVDGLDLLAYQLHLVL